MSHYIHAFGNCNLDGDDNDATATNDKQRNNNKERNRHAGRKCKDIKIITV